MLATIEPEILWVGGVALSILVAYVVRTWWIGGIEARLDVQNEYLHEILAELKRR